MKQTFYWTLPIKENKKWHVNKCNMDRTIIGTNTFHSEPEAMRFLTQINVYVKPNAWTKEWIKV